MKFKYVLTRATASPLDGPVGTFSWFDGPAGSDSSVRSDLSDEFRPRRPAGHRDELHALGATYEAVHHAGGHDNRVSWTNEPAPVSEGRTAGHDHHQLVMVMSMRDHRVPGRHGGVGGVEAALAVGEEFATSASSA